MKEEGYKISDETIQKILEYNYICMEEDLDETPNIKNVAYIAFFKKKNGQISLFRQKISNKKEPKYIYQSIRAIKAAIAQHFYLHLYSEDKKKVRKKFIDDNFIFVPVIPSLSIEQILQKNEVV
jgi:hypothetical protein